MSQLNDSGEKTHLSKSYFLKCSASTQPKSFCWPKRFFPSWKLSKPRQTATTRNNTNMAISDTPLFSTTGSLMFPLPIFSHLTWQINYGFISAKPELVIVWAGGRQTKMLLLNFDCVCTDFSWSVFCGDEMTASANGVWRVAFSDLHLEGQSL